jgi:hypothetical protein
MFNLLDRSKGPGLKINEILRDINKYAESEFIKGFKLPLTGPGDTSGKLFSKICKHVGLVYKKPLQFMLETGRVKDDQKDDKRYQGSVGHTFCEAGSHQDRDILEQMKIKAEFKYFQQSMFKTVHS